MFKQDYMARRIMPLAAAGIAILGAAAAVGQPVARNDLLTKPRQRKWPQLKPAPKGTVFSDCSLPEIERAKRGYLHSHARRRLEEQGK